MPGLFIYILSPYCEVENKTKWLHASQQTKAIYKTPLSGFSLFDNSVGPDEK